MAPRTVSSPAPASTVIRVSAARLPTAENGVGPAEGVTMRFSVTRSSPRAAVGAAEGRRAVGGDREDVRPRVPERQHRVGVVAAVEVHADRRGDRPGRGDLIVAGEPVDHQPVGGGLRLVIPVTRVVRPFTSTPPATGVTLRSSATGVPLTTSWSAAASAGREVVGREAGDVGAGEVVDGGRVGAAE